MTANNAEGKQSFPQPAISEKRWTKDLEKDTYEHWKKTEPYKFDVNSKKKVYSIDTPPPYLNTPIHIGHATTYSLMDMFARYRRMKGFNVLFPLGLDNNGLPIEMAAEKKFKIQLFRLSRDEILKKCRQVLEDAGTASTDSFLKLGIGFNTWKKGTGLGEVYETDSEDYRSLTQDTFIDLWNKGLIYEEERINNYCPGCRTTLADAEIEYDEISSSFNDVKFKVKETGEEIVIGTTRPELISSCRAVIFNPEDKRYKKLQGKTALTAIYDREVPIFAHPQASMAKGTGLVMMSTAGDLADIRFCREMKLSTVISIGEDGKMNEISGFLKGLKVKEARETMIEELKNKNLIVKQTQTTHRTPICDRSGHHIEFIAMKEFYLKQVEFKKDIIKLAKELKFFSESSRQMLLDWIESVSIDWPISRRRYYATEIPLWYCKKCNEAIVPKKGKYNQPWKDPAPVKKCKCGSTEFEGETRVLDTWFDSSNTPLYILKYGKNDAFFKKNSPCTLRPQGKDIVRTWLYYTLLKDFLLTGKGIFKEAWINYYIVDENGKKMSKRKGNVIDPQDILEKHGAEPFRLWAAIEGNMSTSDFRCSPERIDGAGKTIAKLWNVSRFVSMFKKPKQDSKKLLPIDSWIRHEVNKIVKEAEEGYENYDFHNPTQNTKHFLWETFASHYVELAKSRAYNGEGDFTKSEQDAAISTLYYCLERLLLVLAPITPMITYKIYKDLNKKDIHFEDFPKHEKRDFKDFKTADLAELNSNIWKQKKENGLSLKSEIKEAVIPDKFKIIEKDLKTTHKIEKISYGKELKITFSS
jgi:valyl-tRNA synthetase